jgi:predicted nucleotidyltransferase
MTNEMNKIIDYLKKKGCSKIVLFGSYAESGMKGGNDIDVAIRGMNGADFWTAVAELPVIAGQRVDLVDLDDIPSAFRKSIEQNGITMYG